MLSLRFLRKMRVDAYWTVRRTLPFMLLLLTIVSVSFAEESGQQKQLEQSLANWTNKHANIRNRLGILAEQTDQLAQSFLTMNYEIRKSSTSNGAEKEWHEKKANDLFADLYKSYPDILLVLNPLYFKQSPILTEKEGLLKTNPKEVKDAISQIITRWNNHAPSVCIEITSGIVRFKSSVECKQYVPECVTSGYSSKNGMLIVRGLENDLSVTDNQVSTIDDVYRLHRTTATQDSNFIFYPDVVFDACKVLSELGMSFNSDKFAHEPLYTDHPKWAENLYYQPYRAEDFRKECIDAKASEQDLRNFWQLQELYPKYFWNSYWKKYLNTRNSLCKKAVQFLCGGTATIKSTRILSYITIGCKFRQVTASDIRNDMRKMDREAQRLQHSEMLDTIEVCDEAENAGYSFFYTPPQVEKNCKPTTN